MSRDKRNPTPRHPLLRITVARLLMAAPALTLVGCADEYDSGCFPYDAHEAHYKINADNVPDAGTPTDGGLPTEEGCLQTCRRSFPKTLSCEAFPEETPSDGGPRSQAYIDCLVAVPAGCHSDGRLPEGLQAARVEARCALGTWFAGMAWMEAASVPAFLRLAEELEHHGAPAELIRAARRSAGDEVRHARAAGELARRHGTAVPEVELAPFTARSLEALLLENAREGCVRETYGAVVAGWQARTARDERVRSALGPIAEDELRHAELAWAVDAWAAERLTPEARQRVRDARLAAFQELERLVASEAPEAVLVEEAGLPPRDTALQLLQGLQVLLA